MLNVDTHIDDSYVNDDDLKIEIHKLINEIDSFESLSKIKGIIEDRFGKVSENIEIYIILLIVGYFIISGVVENDFQDTDTSYIIRR